MLRHCGRQYYPNVRRQSLRRVVCGVGPSELPQPRLHACPSERSPRVEHAKQAMQEGRALKTHTSLQAGEGVVEGS